MSDIVTVSEALARITTQHLGPEADAHDLTAFRAALARAWPLPTHRRSDGAMGLPSEYVGHIEEEVLQCVAGRDAQGRDWVQVAAAIREAVS